MYQPHEISRLDIETTNSCNAACPQCARTPMDGTDPGLKDFLSFDTFKHQISPSFLNHVIRIDFNGCTGDNVMHPDIIKFCKYVIDNCPGEITLSTNGSMRDEKFWAELGQLFSQSRTSVRWALDGLEDTHKLYRVNTNWQQIINNAKIFIAAGGNADWQMIAFEHNQHQITDCKKLSQELSFKNFSLVKSDRFNSNGSLEVFNRGEFSHIIKKSTADFSAIEFVDWSAESQAFNKIELSKFNIKCKSADIKWLGIYADGTIWPCCYMMGFHKLKHGPWAKIIPWHYQKVLNLGDYTINNLYNHSIEDIVISDFFQSSLPDSFKSKPNPLCISHCSHGS